MRLKAIVCTAVVLTIILLTSLTTVVINNRLSAKPVVNNIYTECSCVTDTAQSSDIDSNDTVSSEATTRSTTTSRAQESKPDTTTLATVTTRPKTTKTTKTTTGKTTTSIAPEQSETSTEPVPQEPQEMREVNINTASADEISEFLLIDIELAEKIVGLREQIGYYSSVDELFYIDGMGEGIIGRVAGYVIV